jgi:hypothetical protein
MLAMVHLLLLESLIRAPPDLEMGADWEVEVSSGMLRATFFHECDFSHDPLKSFIALRPLFVVAIGSAIDYPTPFLVLWKKAIFDTLQVLLKSHVGILDGL